MDDKNPNAFAEMAAALNGHQVTDEHGQIEEETSFENTAAQEENTDLQTAIPEKGAETEESTPVETDEPEIELAGVDESGKRYVPESRFKEVYAKAKELERELEKSRSSKSTAPLQDAISTSTQPLQAPDRTEALEVELLKTTLPQFDQNSTEYSKELDELGGEIYRANPGITRIEAAKRAIKTAEKLSKTTAALKAEARQIKTIQADQGITSRVEKRADNTPDINSMDDKQLEAYLKSIGQW